MQSHAQIYPLTLEYVKAINNPQTPDEFLLAIKDSRSEAYQRMMEMIIAGVEHDIILEKLLQYFLKEQREESQLLEEELREKLKKYLHFQEKLVVNQTQNLASISSFKVNLEQKSSQELTKMIKELREEVTRLQQKKQELNLSLQNVKQKQTVLNQSWKQQMKTNLSNYSLVMPNGQVVPINPLLLARLEKIVDAMPAPSDIYAHVADSVAQQPDDIKRVLPDALQLGQQVGLNASLTVAFGADKALHGEESRPKPSHIWAQRKQNGEVCKRFILKKKEAEEVIKCHGEECELNEKLATAELHFDHQSKRLKAAEMLLEEKLKLEGKNNTMDIKHGRDKG